jgi:hypothetical protein
MLCSAIYTAWSYSHVLLHTVGRGWPLLWLLILFCRESLDYDTTLSVYHYLKTAGTRTEFQTQYTLATTKPNRIGEYVNKILKIIWTREITDVYYQLKHTHTEVQLSLNTTP